MAATNDSGRDTEWDGYSDYQHVSRGMVNTIQNAVEGYATVASLHKEGARVKPANAAEARRKILEAAMNVVVEMEQAGGYDEILHRWHEGEGDEEGEGDKEGYLTRLQETRLTEECPHWLEDMVRDIRTAGWQLGYLKAGREEQIDDEGEAGDSEVMQVIEEMTR